MVTDPYHAKEVNRLSRNEQLFEVAAMFRSLLKSMSHEWNKNSAKQYNLTFPQFQVLYALKLRGPQKVSELAEMLGLTSPAITSLTDKLLASGYVNRERAENDRRVVYTSITEKGMSTIGQIVEDQQEIITVFFEMLSEEDVQHLRRIFSLMLLNIDHHEA
jgi:DNA-binding MarR family transcriptional regulator